MLDQTILHVLSPGGISTQRRAGASIALVSYLPELHGTAYLSERPRHRHTIYPDISRLETLPEWYAASAVKQP